MALALREALAPVCAHWRTEQYAFTLGIGIAQGDATVGVWRRVGRLDYAVLGPVTALAMALGDAAEDGQILLSSAVATAVAGQVATTPVLLCGHPGDVPLGRVLQVCEGRGQ